RLCAPVTGIYIVGNQIGREFGQLIGSGPNRIIVIGKLSRVTADICPDMLRHNENLVTNTEERGAIRVLQRKYDGTAIRRSHILDQRQYTVLVKSRMLLHQVKGEHDIRTGKRLAIVPLYSRA